MTQLDYVDLYAGPGGWDVAADQLGLNGVGIEFDRWACETRRAAGHATFQGDVRDFEPTSPEFHSRGLIASPPCQSFSMAGNGKGRAQLDLVVEGLHLAARGEPLPEYDDARTALSLEPMRWIKARWDNNTPYEWCCFEQVPGVLPLWRAYADILRGLGYHVEVGTVSAEQYGVPQTRKRAILVAHLHREVSLPAPTHMKYKKGVPQSHVEDGLLPWRSMAEALDRGLTERPSMTVTGGGAATGGAEPFGNGARQSMTRAQSGGVWKW